MIAPPFPVHVAELEDALRRQDWARAREKIAELKMLLDQLMSVLDAHT